MGDAGGGGVGAARGRAVARGPARVTTPASGNPKRSTVPKLAAPFDAGMSDAVLLDAVVAFYHRALLEESEALAWLARRRINEEATRAFRLGLSNRTLCFRLPHANRVEGRELRERLQDLGVYRKSSGHEAFRGSVTFPIVDPNDQVVQLYGRKIGGALRKGTPLHTWLASIERPLFNVAALESFDEVIVCASIIDALTFWSAGLRPRRRRRRTRRRRRLPPRPVRRARDPPSADRVPPRQRRVIGRRGGWRIGWRRAGWSACASSSRKART